MDCHSRLCRDRKPAIAGREGRDREQPAPGRISGVWAGDDTPPGAVPVLCERHFAALGKDIPHGPGIIGRVGRNSCRAGRDGLRVGNDHPLRAIPVLDERSIGGCILPISYIPDITRGNGCRTVKATARRASRVRAGNDLPGLTTACPGCTRHPPHERTASQSGRPGYTKSVSCVSP